MRIDDFLRVLLFDFGLGRQLLLLFSPELFLLGLLSLGLLFGWLLGDQYSFLDGHFGRLADKFFLLYWIIIEYQFEGGPIFFGK